MRARGILTLALIAAAALIPPRWLAASLSEAGSERFGELVLGAWILKLALLLLAAAAAVSASFAARGTFEPLVQSGVREPAPVGRSEGVALGLILALALALRLVRLGEGLWFDEIDTLVHYARPPLAQVATTFDSQNHHLLYSLCANVLFAVFGESPEALRLPAVLFGAGSVAALWRLGRLVAPPREALAAAALLACSHPHVWFSQNARGYTALLLFALLGSAELLLMLAQRTPSGWGRPARYGLWMALAVLTHATAVLVVLAHGLIWLAALRRARRRRLGPNRWMPLAAIVLAGLLSLLGYALVLPQLADVLLEPTMPGKASEWKNPLWFATEAVRGLSRGLPGGVFALALGAAVALLGLSSYARQSSMVLATLLGGAALTAATLLALKHNLWPRMFFFSLGFFVLIVLRGVAEVGRLLLRGRVRAAAAARAEDLLLALACAASAAGVSKAFGPKQDFEGALEFVRSAQERGEAVVTLDMTRLPYREVYASGWSEVDSLSQIEALERAHARTWIVITSELRLTSEHPDLWKHLQQEYAVERTFSGTLLGGEVRVLARPPRE